MDVICRQAYTRGKNIYVKQVNDAHKVWNTALLAYETYNAANYASYVQAATEVIPQIYHLTISATGNFTLFWHVRLGGAGTENGDDPIIASQVYITLDAQGVRDAMKLAPAAGAPAAGSVDKYLDDAVVGVHITTEGDSIVTEE